MTTYYAYSPGLVLDPSGNLVAGGQAQIAGLAADGTVGTAAQPYDVFGTPMAQLTSNASGQAVDFTLADIPVAYINWGYGWQTIPSVTALQHIATADQTLATAQQALAIAQAMQQSQPTTTTGSGQVVDVASALAAYATGKGA